MARPGITKLILPPSEFRPDKLVVGFETVRAMIEEDQLRGRKLNATSHDGQFGTDARALANKLLAGASRSPPETTASALYMRDQRIRVVGHLHSLIAEETPERLSTFTIAKQTWAVYAGDFLATDPIKLKQAFRQDLIRSGASANDGWLFAALDCEFYPPTNNYQFHMHGVATDRMIDVVDGLRRRAGYAPWKGIAGVPDCKRPVMISRQPLTDLPRPIAYTLKHFWKVKVGGRARRLPGDEHTRALLFLDTYRLEDLTLLMNLSVRGGRLCHV